MRYCELFRGGPQVSSIGLGTWAIGGREWGASNDVESLNAIYKAIDLGVTFIDTADIYGYGHAEELLGKVLSDRSKGDLFIATKAGRDFYGFPDTNGTVKFRHDYSVPYLIEAVEKSLKRLRIDCIDLLQLHSPDTELLKEESPWEALYQLKKSGKIRFAGLSVQSYKENEQSFLVALRREILDTLQVRYNLLERSAEETLFPKAMENGIGVIARVPILYGLLAGKFSEETRFNKNDHRMNNLAPEKLQPYLKKYSEYKNILEGLNGYSQAQAALAFCIAHPAVSTVIPGAKNPHQVVENCKAAEVNPDIFKVLTY